MVQIMYTFQNKKMQMVYKFIYIHRDETILIKDICKETEISKPTVIKYVRRLEKINVLKRDGKKFHLLQS